MKSDRLLKSFEILCPAGSGVDAMSFIYDLFHTLPRSFMYGIRFLFWLFWWFPCIAIRRFKTAGSLTPDETRRYLRWWESHPWYHVREVLASLKSIAVLARIGKDWEPT